MDNHQINPESIQNDLAGGIISEKDALELLISLVTYSKDAKIRSQCLEIIGRLNILDEKRFTILETFLISDTDQMVRLKAAKILSFNFPKKGVRALKNALNKDTSPLVVNFISNLFKDFKDIYFKRDE